MVLKTESNLELCPKDILGMLSKKTKVSISKHVREMAKHYIDIMIIAGADYSKTSPAVTYMDVDENLRASRIWFRSVSKVKKLHFSNEDSVCKFYDPKSIKDDIGKSIVLRDIVMPKECKASYIAFEGYAYSARGTVFDLGEACQTGKLRAYEDWKAKIRIYDIGVHKRAFTGRGDSDKVSMHDAYWRQWPNDPLKLKQCGLPVPLKKEGVSPTSDIVDSFSVCNLLLLELKARAGMLELKEMPDCIRQAFLYVSKHQPQNLLTTDFMEWGYG